MSRIPTKEPTTSPTSRAFIAANQTKIFVIENGVDAIYVTVLMSLLDQDFQKVFAGKRAKFALYIYTLFMFPSGFCEFLPACSVFCVFVCHLVG